MTVKTKKVQDLTNNTGVAATDKLVGERAGSIVTITADNLVLDGDFSSNGMMARTAAGTYTTHTIAGTTDRITVTDGDGVSGAPTLDIASTYVGQTSITTLGTISTGTWQGTTVAVDQGGTGQTSYTDGQLLIGNTTGNTLAKGTITGGTNLTVTNGGGSITLDVDDAFLLNSGDTGTGTYIFSDIDVGDMDFENQSGSGVLYWDGGGTSGNYALKGVSGFPTIQGASTDYRFKTENDGFKVTYGSGNQAYFQDTGLSFSGVDLSLTDNYLLRHTDTGITASVTQTQGQQALVAEINEISTVANASDTVTLPSAVAGREVTVINNGANTLQIFPASGDNLGQGADTATTLAAGNLIKFISYDTTNWEEAATNSKSPITSTDNAIARYDGTGGKLQDSSVTIDDSDVVSGATQINVDDLTLDGSTVSSSGYITLSPTTNNTVLVSRSGQTTPILSCFSNANGAFHMTMNVRGGDGNGSAGASSYNCYLTSSAGSTWTRYDTTDAAWSWTFRGRNSGFASTSFARLRFIEYDGTESDAIYIDYLGNIKFRTAVQFGTQASITASTTQTQGQGPLTRTVSEVSTVANTNDTVTLPSAAAGTRILVINNGANTLQIFPASGDNLGAGVDTATTLAAGGTQWFTAYNTTNWVQA